MASIAPTLGVLVGGRWMRGGAMLAIALGGLLQLA
jgi:hypothetical protein